MGKTSLSRERKIFCMFCGGISFAAIFMGNNARCLSIPMDFGGKSLEDGCDRFKFLQVQAFAGKRKKQCQRFVFGIVFISLLIPFHT